MAPTSETHYMLKKTSGSKTFQMLMHYFEMWGSAHNTSNKPKNSCNPRNKTCQQHTTNVHFKHRSCLNTQGTSYRLKDSKPSLHVLMQIDRDKFNHLFVRFLCPHNPLLAHLGLHPIPACTGRTAGHRAGRQPITG